MSIFFKSDLYDTLCQIYSEERILENINTLKKLEKPRGYSTFKNSTLWCAEVLKKAGFSANNLNIIMELGSSSAIKAAVESGLGISILSKWAVQDKTKTGMLHTINLKEDEFTRTFRIIYHKKKFKTQASEEFLRFLKSDEIEQIIGQ